MEYKTFALEGIKTKEVSDGWEISGYGSTWARDSENEIVRRVAFTETIKHDMDRMVLLWQHEIHEPIGKITDLFEDVYGLRFAAKISNTTRGRDARQLVADGVIKSLSIGFEVIEEHGFDPRSLDKISLYELSLVTFPANTQAVITGVKKRPINLEQTRLSLLAEIEKCLGESEEVVSEQVEREQIRKNILAEVGLLIGS